MVSCDLKASMVIAGRGARACDMCGKERARWYCAADEAYLCERCDGTVHSANAVAKRHERVKLGPNGAPVKLKPSHHSKKMKSKGSNLVSNSTHALSRRGDVHKWCNTSRKRSRTLRKAATATGQSLITLTLPVNPDQSSFSTIIKEETDDTGLLLYDLLTADDQLGNFSGAGTLDVKSEPFSQTSTLTSKDFVDVKVEDSEFAQEVPTYEPLLQDLIEASHEDFMEKLMPSSPSLCNVSCSSRVSTSLKQEQDAPSDPHCEGLKLEKTPFIMDAVAMQISDLVDSTAGDINESISISEDSDIDTFDVMDLCSNANYDESGKTDELREEYPDMEIWKSAYRIDQGACASIFDGNPFKGKGERDNDGGCTNVNTNGPSGEELRPPQSCPEQCSFKKPLSLQLDYEDIINAWKDRGSLWMDGQRPQIVPDVSFLNNYGGMVMMAESSCNNSMRSQAGQVPALVAVDRGREARVLRYKEKRRTRLFSKKIRYEVRKLNAERRPRMKGRFVKRAAIASMASM